MISIGLPAFKVEYLEIAIDSILSQTFQDFELIIVNDNSPENILKVVDSYNDPRIKYFENEKNLGPIGNWNKCLELSTREYFVLFSDDDIMHEDFLTELLKKSKEHPDCKLIHCRIEVIDEVGSRIKLAEKCPEYESIEDFVFERLVNSRNFYAPGFMVLRKELLNMGGFINFPLAWFSDEATWFSLGAKGGVAYVDLALCKWRYSSSNISSVGAIEPRLIAGDEYEIWFNSFLNTLEITKEKKVNLKQACSERVYKNKINCIIRGSKKGLTNTFVGISTFFSYRSRYKLKMYDLPRIIYHIIK